MKQDTDKIPCDRRRGTHPIILGSNVLCNIMRCVRNKLPVDAISNDWNLAFCSLGMPGQKLCLGQINTAEC